MNSISFTLPELLALIGMVQCTFLIVHITFRAGQISRAGLPLLYFTVLGSAFVADLLKIRWDITHPEYFYLQWFLWFSGPPLSVLVIIQLADMTKTPSIRDYWILLLLPFSMMFAFLASEVSIGCEAGKPCESLNELMNVMGLMAGTISLLIIFSKKNLLKNIHSQRHGRERYWLILALIVLNLLFLIAMLLGLSRQLSAEEVGIARNILGLGFVYLVSTSLLRLFPKNAKSAISTEEAREKLTEEELELARIIENLLNLEKIYQEPTYSRADLARECKTSETYISKIINIYFGKSFPQLMNEHRLEDAKRLLVETDAPIQTVAQEVGFNSLPSFNRVFKDSIGLSPSAYSKKTSQNVK